MECTENLSSYFPSSPSDQFHERFAVHRVSASISIGDFELCLNPGCHHPSGGGWCSSGQLSACTLHPPATISRLPSEILCLFRKLKENADSGKDLWFAAVTRKYSGELSSGSFQFCEKKYNSIKAPYTIQPSHSMMIFRTRIH